MKPIKLQTINEKFKVGTDEYEKLYEDNNFLLVIPLTHDASCKYGSGTKWCTTGRDEEGQQWFNKHNTVGSLGYLIIKDNSLSEKIGSTKFGLYLNKPNMNYLGGRFESPSGLIIYDDKNNPINSKLIANKFDRENLYSKLSMMLNEFIEYSQNKFSNNQTPDVTNSDTLKESEKQNDVGEMITEFINHNFGEYNTEYNNTFDEVTLDVSIEYHVEKSVVWESKLENMAFYQGFRTEYEGTVYIIVDRLLVGLKDEDTWERMYGYDDIPEYIWDEFKETIWGQVKKYFDTDVDFDIYMYTGEYMNESVLNESVLPDGLSDLLFDVIDDYKDNCDFFDDDLDFAEAIINYTISRAVSQEIIEPTSQEYIESLYDELFYKYGDVLMDEYQAICENND